MPKTRQQKQADLDELIEKFKSAKSVVMAEYRGTSVKDIGTFRTEMRKEQVFTKVYKMTLVNKALAALGITAKVDYKQPVVLNISSQDEVAPARILKAVAKDIGYANPEALTRAFTKRVGCSPRDWRAGPGRCLRSMPAHKLRRSRRVCGSAIRSILSIGHRSTSCS